MVNTSYIAAKLFFALGLLNVAIVAVHPRGQFPTELYLNPHSLLIAPGIIPFTEALAAIAFGVVYLFLEMSLKRTFSARLSLIQMACLMVGFGAPLVVVRIWWWVLGVGEPRLLPLPFWSTLFSLTALSASFAVFLFNVFLATRISARPA